MELEPISPEVKRVPTSFFLTAPSRCGIIIKFRNDRRSPRDRVSHSSSAPLRCGSRRPSGPSAVRLCVRGRGIALNALLFLGKLLSGLATGSIAVVADAFNNLSDAASSVITLVGFRLAGQDADQEHPFGHGRWEYLTGLWVALGHLLMGVEIASPPWRRSFPRKSPPSPGWAVVILSSPSW